MTPIPSMQSLWKISGLDLKKSYQKLHSLLTNRGLKPNLHIMENEYPNVLKMLMREVNEKFQLVPTHIHHINWAERAIRTFKENFISGLASTHKEFPLHLCCWLLPQASLKINLIQKSCMNPKLSGYAQLHGEFNYNATSLAPPGTQVIIHEKPTVRGAWASHGVKGWYIGPSMNHYRCHHVYVTKNNRRTTIRLCWIFPTQYSTSLQFFLRKCHRRGAWISPCLEETSTPSAIFQHCQLPNGRNWATLPYVFPGVR